jgi:predicted dehydrogenase
MIAYQPTRREFLKKTTTAMAAGMAVPYVFSAATSKGAESKNDRLNVAAIGLGWRGTDIGHEASQLGNMLACADVKLGTAQKFAEPFGGKCKVYQDYRELLERNDIDAVTIATPDHWHIKIAIDAMKAGKHVYCEKPLSLTLEESNLICKAVKKYKKTFQVGTQQRSEYELRFLKAVAIARSGRLGQRLHAISSVGEAAERHSDKDHSWGPFSTEPPPADLNWDMWLGQAPKVPYCPERFGLTFRWWFEYSGGNVTDWGVHHTDIAFWALAGKHGDVVEANPKQCTFLSVPREQVLGFLQGKVPANDMPASFNVVRTFDVDLKLSNGNTIKLISGPIELLLSGEKGRIRVNRDRLTGKPVEQIDADPKAKREIESLMADIYGGQLPAAQFGHMRNFFDCIRSGKQPVANVFDHVRSVNACHLANVSMLVGRKVCWDPTAGKFKGDDEANALRHREQREPYKITV